MSKTVFLRFADKPTAVAAFKSAGMTIVDPSGADQIATTGALGGVRFDLDVLFGTGVYTQTTAAVLDALGNVITAAITTPVAGYHVNLLWWSDTVAPPNFGAAVITPSSPACVFAA